MAKQVLALVLLLFWAGRIPSPAAAAPAPDLRLLFIGSLSGYVKLCG